MASPRRSAGILLYRDRGDGLEVLLAHPGGPFFARRDEGVWSVPKGEYEEGEEPYAAARREFQEELGVPPPGGPVLDLGEVRQKSGKLVHAWAIPGELDHTAAKSNTFTLEWPPRSGNHIDVPEVDRVEWFPLPVAREKLIPAQVELLDRFQDALASSAT